MSTHPKSWVSVGHSGGWNPQTESAAGIERRPLLSISCCVVDADEEDLLGTRALGCPKYMSVSRTAFPIVAHFANLVQLYSFFLRACPRQPIVMSANREAHPQRSIMNLRVLLALRLTLRIQAGRSTNGMSVCPASDLFAERADWPFLLESDILWSLRGVASGGLIAETKEMERENGW